MLRQAIFENVLISGLIFYTIGKELFSGQSPSGVYDRAFKICKKNPEIVDSLGEPSKGYGEMTRRGRRRHVRYQFCNTSVFKNPHIQFSFTKISSVDNGQL
jgi:import inner membrane translocase subunit TIM21